VADSGHIPSQWDVFGSAGLPFRRIGRSALARPTLILDYPVIEDRLDYWREPSHPDIAPCGEFSGRGIASRPAVSSARSYIPFRAGEYYSPPDSLMAL